ncbi:Transposase-like protein [Phytophthora palmivora]|uniref:Transposase-like protein n=1 Tax=Phytophthora palmivora TaxID=4796 RepID=A0A2P4X6B1_9STRA|nr:Transposase-like protein [Phytophthora palmivora]
MTPVIRDSLVLDARLGIKPSRSMARILETNPDSAVTIEDIHNIRRAAKPTYFDEQKSWIENLISILSDEDHFFAAKVDPDSRISHLFFALKAAVEIFKENPDVILLDCTYKTNVFDMPLLNLVGVTGMNTTIHLAQAFLRNETKDDYVWALKELKRVIESERISFPQVIISDCDCALMNALEVVFPSIPVILCIWHIVMDVRKHAKNSFSDILRKHEIDPESQNEKH